jgi:hypothetical protein
MARAAGVTGGGDAVTVTVAVALTLVSATLRTTTWQVPGASGAEYNPTALTDPHPVPSETDHVTVVVGEPVTAAAKGVVPPTTMLTVVGATAIETWPGPGSEAPQPATRPANRTAAAASRRLVTSARLSHE